MVHVRSLWQPYDKYRRGTTYGLPDVKAFEVQTATNRLYSPGDLATPNEELRRMQYDAAGNLKHDTYTGQGSRSYDAENRMTASAGVSPATYFYDGDGRRVKRLVGSIETWQIYGLGGELIAEYAANAPYTTPQKEYGYRNGQLLITATAGSADWGPPPSYTPPAELVTGLEIKLEHLTELRTAVNQLRQHAGLPNFTFTVDPEPERYVTTVKADHIRQLRQALEGARTELGLPIGGYVHPTLTENESWIHAIDFQEIRSQIENAWNTGTGIVDIRWLVADQLGTPRMIFDQSGSLATTSRHDYLPFGEELFAGTGGRTTAQGYSAGPYALDGARQKFTSKERDDETNLDYFGARYFSSTQGRFTGVDPAALRKKQLINPQDLNRYAYVANNPLAFIDPDGEEKIRVIVRTFIPQKTVSGPHPNGGIRTFEGDNRDVGKPGTYRTQQIITIETDPRRNNGSPIYGKPERDTGMTVEHGWLWNYSKKASGDTLEASVKRDNDVVNIQAKGNENNPLVWGSPGITYDLMIGVKSEGTKGNVTVTVNGEHDGFPAYEVLIVRPETGDKTERVVYGHDPRTTGQTAGSLFPPAEFPVKKKCVQRPGGECQ